jgi:hypothetical protein
MVDVEGDPWPGRTGPDIAIGGAPEDDVAAGR